MPDTIDPADHVRPFVYDDTHTKSLHFSIGELQSRMRLGKPDSLDVEYTRTMMGFLLFNGRPKAIAMIGLGGGSLAKFCYRHLPDAHITVAEINPHVIALRDEFCVPCDDKRFRVMQADGAKFVRDTPKRHDVLLVDGYDYDGMPERLASQAFYDDCHQMLAADGMMVVNLHSEHPDYAILVGRIERSFGANVLKVNVKREGNVVVFASKSALSQQQRWGVLGQPQLLAKEAWRELRPTFDQIIASLHDE
jgi:spermidine synthase